MPQELDFVAIGDMVTDAFIQLKPENAKVLCNDRGQACTLVMNFGDKLEYESVKVVAAVGNSPNASVSAHRLGLRSALVTNTGGDDFGKECIEALEKEGIVTDFVKVHPDIPSNYHYVLRLGAERTILIKHYDYPYEMPDIGSPRWIYLSSLGEKSLPFHHVIADYVRAHPDINLAFQPGTFQIQLGYEKLKDLFEVSRLFFCNVEEAMRILGEKERGEHHAERGQGEVLGEQPGQDLPPPVAQGAQHADGPPPLHRRAHRQDPERGQPDDQREAHQQGQSREQRAERLEDLAGLPGEGQRLHALGEP
jgi:sugar/nucleoside kinase (ribokinase family)